MKMKTKTKTKINVRSFLSAMTAAALLCPITPAMTADVTDAATIDTLDALVAEADSYESAGNYTYALEYITKAAETADTLESEGILHPYLADLIRGRKNSLTFDPQVFITADPVKRIFMGSDGYTPASANAIRLNVDYEISTISHHLQYIPKNADGLCILAALELSSEKTMRRIAEGGDDARLIENLRQLARLEGEVMLAFCPSPNLLKQTRTVAQSFKNAYRYTADLARRYAPNAKLVYALADVTVPGENTVQKFYPGDGYVDVFGVEIAATYSKSGYPDNTAAWDRRGEYYDPIGSVIEMAKQFREFSPGTPVAITAVSFPWEGKAAVNDWQNVMTRFYTELPVVCEDLCAIFYSCKSNALGISNLRQNPEAARLYESLICNEIPSSAPIESIVSLPTGTAKIAVMTTGVFSSPSVRISLNGTEADPDALTLTEGVNHLRICISNKNFTAMAALEYEIAVGETVTVKRKAPVIDYNGNGMVDYSDAELLTAFVAGWAPELPGITDLNGDGKTNLRDVSELRKHLSPLSGDSIFGTTSPER